MNTNVERSAGQHARDVRTIRPIRGREASELADREYGRFLDLVRRVEGDEWARPTDCALWNVHEIVAHQVGHGEAWSSLRAMFHQYRIGLPLARRRGMQPVDAVNEVQVREREGMPPDELVRRLDAVRAGAVRGRARRRWMRPLRFPTPGIGWTSLGKLYDVILTRDTWAHRVDVARATGRELVLTADHDGRIIEDLVADWARLHGRPFALRLLGPAGGVFGAGAIEAAGRGDRARRGGVRPGRLRARARGGVARAAGALLATGAGGGLTVRFDAGRAAGCSDRPVLPCERALEELAAVPVRRERRPHRGRDIGRQDEGEIAGLDRGRERVAHGGGRELGLDEPGRVGDLPERDAGGLHRAEQRGVLARRPAEAAHDGIQHAVTPDSAGERLVPA